MATAGNTYIYIYIYLHDNILYGRSCIINALPGKGEFVHEWGRKKNDNINKYPLTTALGEGTPRRRRL